MRRRPEELTAIVKEALKDGASTADKMAIAAGVSVRTMYRHIKRMRAYGVNIEGARGFGFMLRKGKGN